MNRDRKEPPPQGWSLTTALGALTFKLLRRKLDKTPPGENVGVCPVAIASVLGALALGASEVTEREMRQLWGGLSAAEFLRHLRDWRRGVKFGAPESGGDASNDESVVLAEESLWLLGRAAPVLNPKFRLLLEEALGAATRVERLPEWPSNEARARVDAWCRMATRGQIEEFAESVDSNARVLLASAVFFRGLWSLPFDPQKTVSGLFFPQQQPCFFMSMTAPMLYAKTARGTFVELPYRMEGAEWSAVVALPAGDAADDFLSWLQSGNEWRSLLHSLDEAVVQLSLPRFKLEPEARNELGLVTEVTWAKAAFPGIALKETLAVSQLLQSLALSVDEEGTTAAAVVAASMSRGLPKTHKVVFNRPFFFFVSGCPLVEDAAASSSTAERAMLLAAYVANPKRAP